MIQPVYTAETVSPVHALRYDWTGWLDLDGHRKSRGGSCRGMAMEDVAILVKTAIETCRPLWSIDGMEVGNWQVLDNGGIQILFTVGPQVSPAFCAMRAKGRLDHALRRSPTPVPSGFRRTVSLRTLGDNTRETVIGYLSRQAGKSDYADHRFKVFLDRFNTVDPRVDLSQPQATGHGRYWCNLHLVIVVADRRFPMTLEASFAAVHDAAFACAAAHGHELARISVMPDHVHLALRFSHESSPMGVGVVFSNWLAAAVGMNHGCWSREFYVGTFSEYGLAALR